MKISQLRAWTVALVVCAFMATSACGGGGEARKAEHIAKGERFMAERNYAKAHIEFRNALQIDPKDARLRAQLGLASEKLGNVQEAANSYRLAIAADESLEMPRARLALLLALAGLTDDALELIKPGLERQPRSADLLVARAVATAESDLAASTRDANEAVRLDPNNADAISVLASLMWRQEQRSEALALLERAVAEAPENLDLRRNLVKLLLVAGRTADAEEHLIEVLRLEPERIENAFRLVQVHMLQNQADSAIEVLHRAIANNPENVEVKLVLAQILTEQRSFADAEKQLLLFSEAEPRNLDLRLGVGRFYEANGRTESAERIYQAVSIDAGQRAQGVTAGVRLAAIRLGEGKLEEAAKYLDEILASNPRDADALSLRAEVAMRRGDPAAAVAHLRIALGDQPDSVPLAIALARAYGRSGDRALAEQTLRAAVQARPGDVLARLALAQFLIESGNAARALSSLEQLTSEQPNNADALAALAKVQLASGKPVEASRTAAGLQALHPASAAGYQLAGEAYEVQGQLAPAIAAYSRAAELSPKSLDPIVALVRIDMNQKRPNAALVRLDDAEETNPGSARISALRGDVLMSLGRLDEAIKSYDVAVTRAPNWADGYRGLATAHTAAGRPEIATEVLERGFESTGGAAVIGLDLALSYRRSGRTRDAISTYERLVALRPDDDVAANNLAMILLEPPVNDAQLARAEELSRRFAKGDNPAYLDTYGLVLYQLGRYSDAAEVLSRAVAKAPDAIAPRFHLGMAQFKAGQVSEGRQNLEKVLDQKPDFPGAEAARAALGQM
jgi:tetratricopeptide (TPR) repeat protein